MTKSTITREQLIKKAQEQIEFCRHTKITGEGRAHVNQCAALFEIALAAMDSEPVAEVLSNRPGNDTSTIDRALPVGTQLYLHAQPAQEYPETLPCPVLLEPGLRFGKGIKTSTMLAALARRAVYESDMAELSPEERAEFQAGIEDFKALIAQPAPVVPDDVLDALQKVARIRLDLNDFDGDRRGIADCLGDAEEALIEVVNRRAAMLAAAQQSPGSEPATVPGKWIPVSERMPEDSGRYWCYVEEQNDLGKSHYQWNCSWNGDRWWVESEGGGIVTHWMQLPAAPQEVK